jgi:chorismate dehydratase
MIDAMPHVVCTEAPPTHINRLLQTGTLDGAVLSSFAYAQQAEALFLLPHISISATGAVGSILLFTRHPLRQGLPHTVALTNTSATSAQLLRMIFQKQFHHRPQYVTCSPDVQKMLSQCDAALLIGDEAIKAHQEGLFPHVTDVGQMWYDWTKQPMTYALWAVHASFAQAYPKVIDALAEAFAAAKTMERTSCIARAVRQCGGTATFWDAYYRQLDYDLTETHRTALGTYFQYAVELGLLERMPRLRMWGCDEG